jgi:endonuclease/exonuclease/phosphatase family metal-dependent hydrolase
VKLKVMSFNLRVPDLRDGLDAWPFRVGRAAEAIIRSGVDIIGLQEDKPRMLGRLRNHLAGFDVVAGGPVGTGESCAFAYRPDRVRLLDTGVFWLSRTPDVPCSRSWESAEARLCRWGLFQFGADSGTRFFAYNTHLDHKSRLAREQGAKLMAARIAQSLQLHGYPAFLLGDMNATPEDPTVSALTGSAGHGNGRAMHAATSPSVPNTQPRYTVRMERSPLVDVFSKQPLHMTPSGTYHAFRGDLYAPGLRIDYIFITSDIEVERAFVDKARIRGRYPSDHYPVIAELRLP